jgi:hypothetical protein
MYFIRPPNFINVNSSNNTNCEDKFESHILLMKQQFVVTHCYTILRETEKKT